ncbi:hypothetical protein RRU94_16475 [Domibacillus sp. DTU_2020_1001157_1_SI_ALB_TIR_016]|uniref:hypothetical protein n=1 Tax=Domibacillus sp. DTU_2020_1001157_1_SI_ALB_TIR_016 TaxID=3077789 RepID=UPI0028EDA42A|nr:hypothetical protein [Domibacillus sp. DTU_2020_1001157_1_SI_ALB_TIR_016]WNS82331.1 hypothetical protein RRU94_16475 [Domibacillus sp. DTU_2020_1001157_1_SI_ALB_TIR_016]
MAEETNFIYDLGTNFLLLSSMFFTYIGAIVLVYGNIVSLVIEYFHKKWFKNQDWLYIVILSLFGLANGILFQDLIFAIYGLVAALLYALIDKWVEKRMENQKSIKIIWLIPFILAFIGWLYFYISSPPVPPFTKEEAVEFATNDNETVIKSFPKEVGKWEGTIQGYNVVRETSVKELEPEVYLVTFTEHWSKEAASDSWSLSYKVDRGSLSAYDEKGKEPPYYND